MSTVMGSSVFGGLPTAVQGNCCISPLSAAGPAWTETLSCSASFSACLGRCFLASQLSGDGDPAMDGLDLRLQGEAKGWLDATCTYYGLGWLTPDQ